MAFKHSVRRFISRFGIRINRIQPLSRDYEVNIPLRETLQILKKHDVASVTDWFEKSIVCARNSQDDLTKGLFNFIRDTIPKDSRILVTGCGTGGMLFWIAQQGFSRVEGFDLVPQAINAAKEISERYKLPAKLWVDNGLAPQHIEGKYDLITACYWVYSAWMGNYDNPPREKHERDQLLREFLAIYAPHLERNGLLALELIDSVADYNEPHCDIYPVRHSEHQVRGIAAEFGLSIAKMIFNRNHGYQPRMLYFLKNDKGS